MPDKLNKVGGFFDSIGKIGYVIAAVIMAVVGATIFWVRVMSLESDFDQSVIDYNRDKKELNTASDKKYRQAMLVATDLSGDIEAMHRVIHDLEIDMAVMKESVNQAHSELDNLWMNYNEELRKQISK